MISCQSENPDQSKSSENVAKVDVKFEELSLEQTGIDFVNQFDMKKMKSYIEYINVYNGGGVAIGDVNNDQLEDIYLTGNLVGNKLYINKGNFQFEDVTAISGVGLDGFWSNGATMSDVNGDGWLDIYVCLAYDENPINRANKLFINQKDGTFKEEAKKYGLDDMNYSIQANFFDYDQDGDIDVFVGNHPLGINWGSKDHVKAWKNPELQFSDRLYRNNGNGHFEEVTIEAGILNYGWTLSALTADFNDDELLDIYVAVDHEHPDRLYINQGDGTFKESVADHFDHTSTSSMGADLADINNDGYIDLLSLDMLAKDNYREKTQMGAMNPSLYWNRIRNGYHHQHMRNTLQLNQGNGHYSEIGQFAGIHRTDWSWASLFFDYDNDGLDDLFVTNGYYRDVLDKDETKGRMKTIVKAYQKGPKYFRQAIDSMNQHLKATPIPNDFFRNEGDFRFKDMASEVGLNHKGFSAGAAYADLDNDGDLDLVVCNIDENVSVYRNNAVDGNRIAQNFITLTLSNYPSGDPQGTSLTLHYNDQVKRKYFLRTRGYASSVGSAVHFGLGQASSVDKLEIIWPNGQQQVINDLSINTRFNVTYNPEGPYRRNSRQNIFSEVDLIDEQVKHREDNFDDYVAQVLLPHQMSRFGPFLSKGDVNGDGLEDIFIGGAAGQPGTLLEQTPQGTFSRSKQSAFEIDQRFEDLGSALFDADGDGDLDLYVASGGNHKAHLSKIYKDRLYINDNGLFTRDKSAIPDVLHSGGRVAPGDFDNDGDLDLFVSGRHIPHEYPKPASSTLLRNDNGIFVDVTDDIADGFQELGLCTDAVWADINQDGYRDLIAVGEWMPITVFIQKDGRFVDATESFGLEETTGWWNRIVAQDLNGDGTTDFVVGNLGDNYKYQASEERPFHVYAKDFDNNNTYDIALGYYLEGNDLFPVRGRQCSSEQVPEIADKFPTYDAFAKASLKEIYGQDLEGAIHYEAKIFSSVVLENIDGGLRLKKLPTQAQFAPINGIVIADYNQDGHQDLLIAGNLYVSEVETGRADAGNGLLLLGDGQCNFRPMPSFDSGFYAEGDVKDLIQVNVVGERKIIFVSRNDGPLSTIEAR